MQNVPQICLQSGMHFIIYTCSKCYFIDLYVIGIIDCAYICVFYGNCLIIRSFMGSGLRNSVYSDYSYNIAIIIVGSYFSGSRIDGYGKVEFITPCCLIKHGICRCCFQFRQ